MRGDDRRKREFMRRQDEILDAAVGLFDERADWQDVTIDDIAERAEIGKGTVYKHFTSKEELYGAVAGRFQRRVMARVQRIEDSLSPAEAVAVLVRIHWDEYRALSPGLSRVVDFCGRAGFADTLGTALREELAAAEAAFAAAATSIIARGMADGVFARRPLPRMVFLVQATLMGAVRLAAGGRTSAEQNAEYRDALVLYLLDGLMEPAQRTRA